MLHPDPNGNQCGSTILLLSRTGTASIHIGCNAGQVNRAGGRMGGKVLHSCLLLPPLQHWGLRRQVRGDNAYFLLIDEGAEPRAFLMFQVISWHDPYSVLWIQIRIHLDVLDPDPYWECGSGSGSRSMEIDQNLLIDLVSAFQKGFFTFVGTVPVCFLAYYLL